MYSYEIPKRIGYPKTVFYDDGVVFYYKDGREIGVKASDIERISYVKPSLINYIGAVLSLMFCGTGEQPGRMEIYLHDSVNGSLLNRADNRKLYLVKIAEMHIYKLPEFFKRKMGLYD